MSSKEPQPAERYQIILHNTDAAATQSFFDCLWQIFHETNINVDLVEPGSMTPKYNYEPQKLYQSFLHARYPAFIPPMFDLCLKPEDIDRVIPLIRERAAAWIEKMEELPLMVEKCGVPEDPAIQRHMSQYRWLEHNLRSRRT